MEEKQFQFLFEQTQKNVYRLQHHVLSSSEKYMMHLTEINLKLDAYKPKAFWQTGTFWIVIIQAILCIALGIFIFSLGNDCFYWNGEVYGICSRFIS